MQARRASCFNVMNLTSSLRQVRNTIVLYPRRIIAILCLTSILIITYLNSSSLSRSYRGVFDRNSGLDNQIKYISSLSPIFNISRLPGDPQLEDNHTTLSVLEATDAFAIWPRAKCDFSPLHSVRYAPISAVESNSTVFLALNLFNSENILPNFLHQLPFLLRYLGPHRVHISIYENGSRDSTPQLLRLLGMLLDNLGSSYTIVARGQSMKAADKKKKNARIPVLAFVRNAALGEVFNPSSPVASKMPGGKFDIILFMNDIIWCAADVLEVLLQKELQHADMTCSTDWESHIIWDRWVIRSMSGGPFYLKSDLWTYFYGLFRFLYRPIPIFLPNEPDVQSRFGSNLATQVFSCWNGMAAISSSVFLPPNNIQFRTAQNDLAILGSETDKESECFLICVDLWKAGFSKIMATRRSSVAYTVEEYNYARQDTDPSLAPFQESERIHWIQEPPKQVAYHDWAKWTKERWGPWNEA